MARKTYDDQHLYEINTRFQEAFEILAVKKGIGRKKLAKEIGYNTTRQLYNIFDGNSLVPMVALYYLSKKYDVSLDWLFHGSGTLYRSDSASLEELKAERDKLLKGRENARKIIEKLIQKDKINTDLQLAFSENEDDQIELMKLEADYYDQLYKERVESEDAEKKEGSNDDKKGE